MRKREIEEARERKVSKQRDKSQTFEKDVATVQKADWDQTPEETCKNIEGGKAYSLNRSAQDTLLI